MAKEYIEREAVLRHKRKMSGADFGGAFWDEAVLCEEIRKIPAADVVAVVRCKDCRNFGEDVGMSKGGVWARCLLHGRILCERDFCSYGEKMDGKDGEKTWKETT